MLTKILQPLWYHPTSLMLIDDDKEMLKSLMIEVDPLFPPVAYTNPTKALEHLKKEALPLEQFSQNIISEADPIEAQQLSGEIVAIDFATLHADLDKATRFKRIAVVVVDKVMEEMDGLEFCRQVRQLGLPVKLILLTGKSDDKEAISAFNNRTIDAFIQKTADDMTDQINHQLNQLAFQVFCESSMQLMGPIVHRFLLLTQPQFADFFKKLCQEHNIVEYYLLDSSGSYLLITKEGKMKILLMKSASDFKNACDIADTGGVDNEQVLEALKNHTAFPFTGIDHSYFNSDITRWKDAMVPMKKQNNLDMYYGVFDISQKTLFFNHYLNEIWVPKVH